MPKSSRGRLLRDAYKFAGFFPASRVFGVFGNPQVRVLNLRRRQKKRRVGSVVVGIAASTIRSYVWYETCLVGNTASIWSCSCAG
jgi:hypothetical protein